MCSINHVPCDFLSPTESMALTALEGGSGCYLEQASHCLLWKCSLGFLDPHGDNGLGSQALVGEKRVFLKPKVAPLCIWRARFGALSTRLHTPRCRQDGGYDKRVVSVLWKMGKGEEEGRAGCQTLIPWLPPSPPLWFLDASWTFLTSHWPLFFRSLVLKPRACDQGLHQNHLGPLLKRHNSNHPWTCRLRILKGDCTSVLKFPQHGSEKSQHRKHWCCVILVPCPQTSQTWGFSRLMGAGPRTPTFFPALLFPDKAQSSAEFHLLYLFFLYC